MTAFLDDLTEDMKNPKFAYEFGRNERELEIIKLLEELIKSRPEDWQLATKGYSFEHLIALIKGEK